MAAGWIRNLKCTEQSSKLDHEAQVFPQAIDTAFHQLQKKLNVQVGSFPLLQDMTGSDDRGPCGNGTSASRV
ncbi:hypothetical protein FOPE_08416 [Fonsecaea pedrosoi]|nr:hypothetical protein FOPE_08416 [Fonsecaea pedrosoi]